MTKLRKPITFETLGGQYQMTEILGKGGAGRVLRIRYANQVEDRQSRV